MGKSTRIDTRQARKQDQREISSEILDRAPPQNLEAERAVIGSILLDANMCDEVTLILTPDDFHNDANAKLYSHIVAMHDAGKTVDVMLLHDQLVASGDLAAIGGEGYLAEVASSVPYAANAVYYANIVREKATLRELIHASTAILADAFESTLPPMELVSQCEQKLFAVHDRRSTDQISDAKTLMSDALAHIDARAKGGSAGVPTGFRALDNLTGGFHESEFIVLAARPSMGKTAIALNIVENVVLKAQQPTLFCSLEMSQTELAMRLLCSRGKINASKFRTGYLSPKDHEVLAEVSSELSASPLFVDDSPSRTVTQIAAIARRLKRRHGLAMIALDYLQLLQPDDPRDPRQEQVAKMARRLKGLARELKVPVLCLAQLNRQTEVGKGFDGHRPKLSQLRESGAIEQDADVVMFIHREEYYHSVEAIEDMVKTGKDDIRGQAQLIIAKQRNGPIGDVDLCWFPEFTRFESRASDRHHEFAEHGASEDRQF